MGVQGSQNLGLREQLGFLGLARQTYLSGQFTVRNYKYRFSIGSGGAWEKPTIRARV